MSGINVRLFGLDKARLIPDEIEARLARFRLALVEPLVEDFKRTEPENSGWPKGRRKTIQDQTKGIIRGETIIVGTFHSRFARALDTGGTVTPKPGGVLRFRNRQGDFVFTRKPITHAPRPFFGRVLEQVPSIVRRVYETVFLGGEHG